MINPVSVQKGKRGRRSWILPGLLGVFLLHPLYSNLSSVEKREGRTAIEPSPSVSSGELPSKPLSSVQTHPEPASHREEKIFKILSKFVTGLTDEQELKLASFIGQESRRYGFEPELIMAVISTESSFYNWSTSSKRGPRFDATDPFHRKGGGRSEQHRLARRSPDLV
jgi:hypothetical protein